MENRKLIMLAAEEERRQKILSERKKFHKEATERFRQATERCKAGSSYTESLLPSFPLVAGLMISTDPYTTMCFINNLL